MVETSVRWTAEQAEAIAAQGCDLLVSAAAGSGKTSVLVERCYHLIAEAEPRSSLDRLLVVTFTEKAAAEMKGRLRSRLRRESKARPEDRLLAEQLRLLDRARISTIHGFCSQFLRRHFLEANLDPQFGLLAEPAGSMLREKVLDDLFEDRYAESGDAGEAFRRLVDHYGGGFGDSSLREAVRKADRFLSALPDPESWFEKVRRNGEDKAGDFWLEKLAPLVEETVSTLLHRIESLCDQAERLEIKAYCTHLGALHGTLHEWRRQLDDGMSAELYREMRNYDLGRFPTVRNLEEEGRQLAEAAKAVRREWTKGLSESFCAASFEDACLMSRVAGRFAVELAELVREFRDRYEAAKRARGVVDFSDLELLTYRLLKDPDSPKEAPRSSESARRYRDRLDHILVDEYQDTNPLQHGLLLLLAGDEDEPSVVRRFMVGDVKQCIYRFRQADPALFVEMYLDFSPTSKGRRRRIDLQANFRSRSGVIDGVNGIFRRLMSPAVGGIVYDGHAELVCAAAYPKDDGAEGPSIECHLLEKKVEFDEEDESEKGISPSDLEAVEREAVAVARRILRMVGRPPFGDGPEFSIWDKENGVVRPVEFRDIAVLLRSTSVRGLQYATVLQRFGIPVEGETNSDLFKSPEGLDLYALCQALSNPRLDIPTASVLRSPFFRFSDDDLYAVRCAREKDDYWDALAFYGRQGPDEGLREKCRRAVETMDRWRTRFRREAPAEVLHRILDETGYAAYVEGLKGSADRRGFLHQFLRLAEDFTESGERGGIRFLEVLEALAADGSDLGSPESESESANAVRLMSIHKSKGLEFPVAFVADLGKKWNEKDSQGPVLLHREEGIALGWVDPERHLQQETPLQKVVSRSIRKDGLSEEMRILYVALTRAREKLILSASVDSWTTTARWPDGDLSDPVLRDAFLLSAKTPISWIGPALADHRDAGEVGSFDGDPSEKGETVVWSGPVCRTEFHPAPVVEKWSREYAKPGARPGTVGKGRKSAAGERNPKVDEVLDRLRWTYSFERLTMVPARRSVSEVLADRDDPAFAETAADFAPVERPSLPRPGAGFGPSFGILRGRAAHKFLQWFDLSLEVSPERMKKEADRLAAEGFLREDERSALPLPDLLRFLDSDLGRRLRRDPSRVRRELEFTAALPFRLFEPNLRDDMVRERVLVRGVIDCLVEEDDGFLIIDYKTDQFAPGDLDRTAERYAPQVRLYAQAVETILGRSVRRQVLAFLSVGEVWWVE